MRGGLFFSGLAIGAAAAAAQGAGAINGSVFDSLRARPLAGATVMLEGTAFSARTDSAGHFAFDSIPAGAYALGVESASLDSLGVGVPGARVTVAAAGRATVVMGSPSRRSLSVMVCGAAMDSDAGVLIGVVRDAASGKPAEGASVDVEWTALAKQNGAVVAQRASVTSPVAARGLYRACGVPADGMVRVHASLGALASGMLDLAIAAYGFARRDLLIGADSGGALLGIVRDSAGAPLAGARIALAGDSAYATSDDRGAFTLSTAAGTREIEVRRLDFAPWRDAVDIKAGVPTQLTVTMSRPPAVLATVNVRGAIGSAGDDAEGFAARKARGIGRFIDRKAIETHGDVEAIELLRGTPGIAITYQRGQTVATWNRSGTSCRPTYYLDGQVTDARGLPRANAIESVEIYAPSEVPPRFSGSGARCAVVVFWTRRAPAGAPSARAPPDSGASR